MKKRFLSLILVLAMMVGVFTPLLTSADDATEPTKVKVNVHKILISQDALDKHDLNKKYDPTKGVNVKEFFGDDNAKEINGVFFVAIKEGEDGYADFDTKTREEQDAILATATRTGITGDKTEGKNYPDGVVPFELDNPGNYKIYEVKHKSTYKGPNGEVLTGMKAIPVDLKLPEHARTEAGVQSEIHVYPKNSEKKIKFDKNFKADNNYEVIKDDNNLIKTGADVEKYNKEKAEAKAFIGKEIEYESLAKLPKGSVFTKLDLEDSMDKGLKYKPNSVTITVTPALTNPLAVTTDYTITEAGNGFKLEFTQAGLDKLNTAAKANDLDIKFEYKATVTADAINDQPMDNHITLRFNHEPPTPSSEKVTPKEGKINVSKTWVDAEDKTLSAPSGARVTYMLLDGNDKPVADVTFTAAQTVDNTDLGNGIKFKVTGDFAGTFTGLKGTEYKVKEIVDGYEPEYTVNKNDGSVAVKNKKTPNSITPTPPKVTVGGKKFVKVGENDTRLAGAEFVIQNKNATDTTNNNKYLKINGTGNEDAYIKAEKDYNDAIQAVNEALKKGDISDTNKVTIGKDEYSTKDTAMAKVAKLEKARNEAFVNATLTYTWVDSKDDATKFNTNEYGQFEVTGLAYGNYSAVETKAPAEYALPSNGSFDFEVKKGSYKEDPQGMDYKIKVTENEKVVEKVDGQGKKITNTKVSIPQTGGIGTIIFTAIGLAIMASAIIAIKKRQATEAR